MAASLFDETDIETIYDSNLFSDAQDAVVSFMEGQSKTIAATYMDELKHSDVPPRLKQRITTAVERGGTAPPPSSVPRRTMVHVPKVFVPRPLGLPDPFELVNLNPRWDILHPEPPVEQAHPVPVVKRQGGVPIFFRDTKSPEAKKTAEKIGSQLAVLTQNKFTYTYSEDDLKGHPVVVYAFFNHGRFNSYINMPLFYEFVDRHPDQNVVILEIGLGSSDTNGQDTYRFKPSDEYWKLPKMRPHLKHKYKEYSVVKVWIDHNFDFVKPGETGTLDSLESLEKRVSKFGGIEAPIGALWSGWRGRKSEGVDWSKAEKDIRKALPELLPQFASPIQTWLLQRPRGTPGDDWIRQGISLISNAVDYLLERRKMARMESYDLRKRLNTAFLHLVGCYDSDHGWFEKVLKQQGNARELDFIVKECADAKKVKRGVPIRGLFEDLNEDLNEWTQALGLPDVEGASDVEGTAFNADEFGRATAMLMTDESQISAGVLTGGLIDFRQMDKIFNEIRDMARARARTDPQFGKKFVNFSNWLNNYPRLAREDAQGHFMWLRWILDGYGIAGTVDRDPRKRNPQGPLTVLIDEIWMRHMTTEDPVQKGMYARWVFLLIGCPSKYNTLMHIVRSLRDIAEQVGRMKTGAPFLNAYRQSARYFETMCEQSMRYVIMNNIPYE